MRSLVSFPFVNVILTSCGICCCSLWQVLLDRYGIIFFFLYQFYTNACFFIFDYTHAYTHARMRAHTHAHLHALAFTRVHAFGSAWYPRESLQLFTLGSFGRCKIIGHIWTIQQLTHFLIFIDHWHFCHLFCVFSYFKYFKYWN